MWTLNDLQSKRVCIVYGSNGHYYLCPVEHREKADSWLEYIEEYWEDPSSEDTVSQLGPTPQPEWMVAINGTHTLSFTAPKEDQ